MDSTAEMTFMPKQRLRNVKRDIFAKLANLPVAVNALNGADDGNKPAEIVAEVFRHSGTRLTEDDLSSSC